MKRLSNDKIIKKRLINSVLKLTKNIRVNCELNIDVSFWILNLQVNSGFWGEKNQKVYGELWGTFQIFPR